MSPRLMTHCIETIKGVPHGTPFLLIRTLTTASDSATRRGGLGDSRHDLS